MLYKHYYYFVTEFSLVTQRELDALKDLTARLITNAQSTQQQSIKN
uniref:BH4_AAA_HYDROXYL_2 domain-containing protein n=1 Tax=Meloidogyne hapla TaxID=6305 RepID=A0A1I8BNH6_MELHA